MSMAEALTLWQEVRARAERHHHNIAEREASGRPGMIMRVSTAYANALSTVLVVLQAETQRHEERRRLELERNELLLSCLLSALAGAFSGTLTWVASLAAEQRALRFSIRQAARTQYPALRSLVPYQSQTHVTSIRRATEALQAAASETGSDLIQVLSEVDWQGGAQATGNLFTVQGSNSFDNFLHARYGWYWATIDEVLLQGLVSIRLCGESINVEALYDDMTRWLNQFLSLSCNTVETSIMQAAFEKWFWAQFIQQNTLSIPGQGPIFERIRHLQIDQEAQIGDLWTPVPDYLDNRRSVTLWNPNVEQQDKLRRWASHMRLPPFGSEEHSTQWNAGVVASPRSIGRWRARNLER